jgi:hypothetical protein
VCVCFLFCDSMLQFILLVRFILFVIFCSGLFVIFGEFFAKFGFFIWFREADTNART